MQRYSYYYGSLAISQDDLYPAIEPLACQMAAPALWASRGTAGARWSRDGAHSGSLLIMLKYQYLSSRGTSRGTTFPAGARAPADSGVTPPMLKSLPELKR